jgi:shikimate kinase
MNIVLIGMRSCGKSNISRRLSVYTKRAVLSTDVMISYENQGDSISTILEKNGSDWRVFRELEYLIVKKIVTQDNLIIDTGGGVVVDLDQENNEVYSQRKVDLLKENGLIIWLKGDISLSVNKTSNNPNRPILNKEISDFDLMQKRLPFYQESADIIINIDGKRRKEIAHEVMGNLREHPDFSDLEFFRARSER